jgi:hypothetical protein
VKATPEECETIQMMPCVTLRNTAVKARRRRGGSSPVGSSSTAVRTAAAICSGPRAAKRKMSSYQLKRAKHRSWPQPTMPSAQAVSVLWKSRPGDHLAAHDPQAAGQACSGAGFVGTAVPFCTATCAAARHASMAGQSAALRTSFHTAAP